MNWKFNLSGPVCDQEMKAAALNALENDRYINGENVIKFEEEFAAYIGTKYAVSTSSGTHALHFALTAVGVKEGVGVLTSPYSFVATANSIIHARGTPQFADIEPDSFTINPDEAKKHVKNGTKVLLPVHLCGFPADMNKILTVAEEKNLCVVEDACQAHGATYDGKRVGRIGVAGCFSFYPSKNMTVLGDGGMVTSNSEEIALSVSKLRDAGRKSKYEHDVIGYTARLSSVSAAIGRVQLRRLDDWNAKRKKIATQYINQLKELDQIKLPLSKSSKIDPVYSLFAIRTPVRDALKFWLEKSGVECGIHYPIPIHLQPAYKKIGDFGSFPQSENLAETCLSLPIHQNLKDDDVNFVCEQIKAFFSQ
jgi:perosamine synthetase